MADTLLAAVPEPARSQVLAACRRRSFRRGEVVFHEGDPGDSLLVVETGRLLVRTHTETGEAVTLDVAGPGDALGEIALVAPDGVRTATVQALDDVTVLTLGSARFRELCAEHPELATASAALLARRVDRLTGQLKEALYVGVDRRVARRLWTVANLFGGPVAGTVVPLTQQDIADLAGAARPTVNQSLQKLQAQGAIELLRGRVRIVDPVVLRKRTGL